MNIDLKYLCTNSLNPVNSLLVLSRIYRVPENKISFESNLWSFVNVSDEDLCCYCVNLKNFASAILE